MQQLLGLWKLMIARMSLGTCEGHRALQDWEVLLKRGICLALVCNFCAQESSSAVAAVNTAEAQACRTIMIVGSVGKLQQVHTTWNTSGSLPCSSRDP
eukprot:2777006-Amphidinium_carterae.1